MTGSGTGPACRGLAVDAHHLAPAARRTAGDCRRSPGTAGGSGLTASRCSLGVTLRCDPRSDLLPLTHGPRAVRALPARREPPRGAGRGRLHRRRRRRRLRRPLADLARWSRTARIAVGQLRRRGLRGDARPRPRPSPRWSTERRSSTARGDRHRRGRRGDRRADAGQAARRPARRRRAAPRAWRAPPPRSAAPRRRPSTGERVAVAMSGGVDSAVAALLERERGAEVVGVTLKLWADPETDGAKACCSPEAVLGARARRPLARHPAPHPRPRGGVPPPRRRPLRLDGYAAGAHAQPLHRSATARCGSRRWSTSPSGSAPTASSPATTPASSRTATGRCSPPAADEAKDQSYMLAALPPALLGRARASRSPS